MAYFAAIITSDGFIVALDLRDLVEAYVCTHVSACVCVCVCVCKGEGGGGGGGGETYGITVSICGWGQPFANLHGKTVVTSLQM